MNLKSRAKRPLFVSILQIQPHFMYNTLTTIKALCKAEPDLAAKTITNFADYLRGNMDFASPESTIPFENELNHTRIYTEIEALRFDNNRFEFKIEDTDFEIPALTVQPMVENAVRHGVRSKPDAHIGLLNTRLRVERLVNGKFSADSVCRRLAEAALLRKNFAGEYMSQYSWGEDSIYRFE